MFQEEKNPQGWASPWVKCVLRTCMLLPVTARIVYPTCAKTVRVGNQMSVDCTRRTRGCLERVFQYL